LPSSSAAERRELVSKFGGAIDQLTPRWQKAIRMYRADELTFADIRRQLQISTAGVSMIISRRT
jgi:DNA-directed RNA polymerase specialized sigma subunit